MLPCIGLKPISFSLSDTGFLCRCGIIVNEHAGPARGLSSKEATKPNDSALVLDPHEGRRELRPVDRSYMVAHSPASPTHKKISKRKSILNEFAYLAQPASGPFASVIFSGQLELASISRDALGTKKQTLDVSSLLTF